MKGKKKGNFQIPCNGHHPSSGSNPRGSDWGELPKGYGGTDSEAVGMEEESASEKR